MSQAIHPRIGIDAQAYRTWVAKTVEGQALQGGIYLVETTYGTYDSLKVGMTHNLRGPRPLASTDRDPNMRVMGVLGIYLNRVVDEKEISGIVSEVEDTIFNIISARFNMPRMTKEILQLPRSPRAAQQAKEDVQAILASFASNGDNYSESSEKIIQIRQKYPDLTITFQYFSAADITRQIQGIELLPARTGNIVRSLSRGLSSYVDAQRGGALNQTTSRDVVTVPSTKSTPLIYQAAGQTARDSAPVAMHKSVPKQSAKKSHTHSARPLYSDARLLAPPSQDYYAEMSPIPESNVRHTTTNSVWPYQEKPYTALPPNLRPLKSDFIDPGAKFQLVRSVAPSGVTMYNVKVKLPNRKTTPIGDIETLLPSEHMLETREPLKQSKGGNEFWYSFTKNSYNRARALARRHLGIAVNAYPSAASSSSAQVVHHPPASPPRHVLEPPSVRFSPNHRVSTHGAMPIILSPPQRRSVSPHFATVSRPLQHPAAPQQNETFLMSSPERRQLRTPNRQPNHSVIDLLSPSSEIPPTQIDSPSSTQIDPPSPDSQTQIESSPQLQSLFDLAYAPTQIQHSPPLESSRRIMSWDAYGPTQVQHSPPLESPRRIMSWDAYGPTQVNEPMLSPTHIERMPPTELDENTSSDDMLHSNQGRRQRRISTSRTPPRRNAAGGGYLTSVIPSRPSYRS